MKLSRTLALGFAVAAISAAACSSQQGSVGGSHGNTGSAGFLREGQGNTGSVGLHLNIPNSTFTIGSLGWTISNGTNSYTGTINMTDDAGNAAQSIEFVAGPVVAGNNYVVSLQGSDSNMDPCSGSSPPFSVTAGTSVTAQAGVTVTCTVPTDGAVATTVDSGSVAVDAGVVLVNQNPFQCPGITGVSISPAELHPPETGTLTAGVAAGMGGTQDLLWTATCGTGTPTITNPTSPNATFGCGTALNTDCTLTLTVGLIGTGADGGSVGEVCKGLTNTTISETIHCENGGIACPSLTPTLCGSTCVNTTNDVNNCGGCGTVCPTGDTCTNSVCSAPPPTACTKAPCSPNGPNSVQCPNSPTSDGVCTTTEAAIVAKDIAAGFISGGQLLPFSATTTVATQGSCYNCLNAKSCLDDNNGDVGNECGDSPDLTGQGGGTAGTAGQGPSLCMTVFNCILNTDCQGAGGISGTSATTAQENVNLCYCGGNNAGSVCGTAGSAVNGPCVNQETAGSGFALSDNKDMLANFGAKTFPYGIANHILQCATSQKCSICAAE